MSNQQHLLDLYKFLDWVPCVAWDEPGLFLSSGCLAESKHGGSLLLCCLCVLFRLFERVYEENYKSNTIMS